MLFPFITVFATFTISGVMMIYLGLQSRKAPPLNPWIDVRTKTTMRDTETFAQANRAIWWTYVASSVISIIAGIVVMIVGLIDDEAYPGLGGIAVGASVLILALTLYGGVLAHRSIR